MSRRLWVVVTVVFALLIAGGVGFALHLRGSAPRVPLQLSRVGPVRVSNQTSQPLALHGQGFVDGMQLRVGAPLSRLLPVKVVDGSLAYTRLPPIPLGESRAEVRLSLSLIAPGGIPAPGEALITLINDAGFPDPMVLASSPEGRWMFAASPTTDEIVGVEVATARLVRLPALDGPMALAAWTAADGSQWLVAAHRFSPALKLWRTDGDAGAKLGEAPVTREVPAPAYAEGLVIAGPYAWVAEHVRDTVVRISLEGTAEQEAVPVAPNPRELAFDGEALWVGSLQAGTLERVEPARAEVTARLQPGPGAEILGGRTEPFSSRVMGGTALRALAHSSALGVLFATSIGPNIGPNPEKMEVSMNGGVSVYATTGTPRFVRHLGFGAGVPEGLALDDARGLLYVADPALGLIRILDARRLAGTADEARRALLAEFPIAPPEDFPRFRPPADFSVQGRAGEALHSGPRALQLSADGRTLYVLARFTGRLLAFDVSRRGAAEPVGDLVLVNALTQPRRRLGQILYYADLGRTAMSCDACHPEGHTGGVLFEKTRPLRIYRSTSLRGAHDTPPFFIPESTRSLPETAQDVGTRNRFGNPAMLPQESAVLALFSGTFTFLPNPFAGPDGAPPERLDTGGGKEGRPAEGRALFAGKAGCIGCHPPPLYTTDQDPGTRGRFLDVGTPALLPLRADLQDPHNEGFPPPALMGAWDVFPMLTSGSAGLAVEGESLRVAPSALRAVLEQKTGGKHGHADQLSPQEREDLLAWLLTL